MPELSNEWLLLLIAKIDEADMVATSAPWHVSPNGRIVQTAHVTRDVWTIPHRAEDMPAICELRNSTPDVLLALRELVSLRQEAAELRDGIDLARAGRDMADQLAKESVQAEMVALRSELSEARRQAKGETNGESGSTILRSTDAVG